MLMMFICTYVLLIYNDKRVEYKDLPLKVYNKFCLTKLDLVGQKIANGRLLYYTMMAYLQSLK